MGGMGTPRTTRSSRLLKVLADFEQVFVVAHNHPDPDAVASGWAVSWMIREKLGKPVRLIGGGDILRAENRHMIKLLEPPIELVREPPEIGQAAVVLVDCAAGQQNHLLAANDLQPTAVIDHHPPHGPSPRLAFRDVRPRAAATASIAASYLREQKLPLEAKMATALLFAVRTETRGSETHYSRLDRSMLLWLTEHADPSRLAEIESAPLSPGYYGDLVLALQSTFIYDDAALCLLPRATAPEIVAEVADLLIRCRSIRRVLCGAVVQEDLLVSVRTSEDGPDAAELARTTLAGLGSAGGHRYRAGGKIPGAGGGQKIAEDLQDQLRTRWLDACGVDRQRGTRLVPKREIVENL